MSQIFLDVPEDSMLDLKLRPDDEFGETLRMAAAVKLFELGRLSSGEGRGRRASSSAF